MSQLSRATNNPKCKKYYLQDRQIVPLVVPGLSVNSESSSSATPSPESLGPEASLASGNRAAASSSSDSALGRSDETSSGKLGQESSENDKNDPLSRYALLGKGFHSRSVYHRSACTSTHFSGFGFGTFYESGNEVEETWHLHSLPERQKLRRLLENQITKASCRRRTGESLPRAKKFGADGENAVRMTIWRTPQTANNTFWSNG